MSIDSPWGYYAPPKYRPVLKWLTSLGLGRGALRHLIIESWLNLQQEYVDVEVRGIKYRLDIRNNTTDAKILCGSNVYDKPELAALAKLAGKNGSVFVDLGANTGYYTLAMLEAGFDRIVALEPSPKTRALLEFNVSMNDANGITEILALGVGESGEMPFYTGRGMGGSGLLPEAGESPAFWIKTLPLMEICKIHGIDSIDGMKVDIEGYEPHALAPFLEQAPDDLLPRVLILEDNVNQWEIDLIGLLKSRQYSVVGLTRSNFILKLGFE